MGGLLGMTYFIRVTFTRYATLSIKIAIVCICDKMHMNKSECQRTCKNVRLIEQDKHTTNKRILNNLIDELPKSSLKCTKADEMHPKIVLKYYLNCPM